ncbi:MAG: ABC transporter ATP-binding protein/permease [Clostridia bacterium]|nr:ABC transporter ATP-binding protein/permease [Clostridia bacterium]
MLKLNDIKKDYEAAGTKVPALRGVSLEFRSNEFVCILGASGCGKTTLLNIIGGLDHYTSGDLIIRGVSTKDYKDRDWDVYRNHRIGFVFQSYNLIPHQTVLGNVELALTIAGISKAERRRRAKEALYRVGLKEEINKKPNQLSGGQMQRVAIARALVNNPEILLADEPTGALDSKTSVQIMDLIREIAGERLVIMVTHNPELAEQYATRIVELKDGLVVADSNPYDGTSEREQLLEKLKGKGWTEENMRAWKRAKIEKEKLRGREKAAMSYGTSLGLSARNLVAKKGRTVVTSIAGSIGIISVCLVLALSNGFNAYIRHTEEDMLSYYPLQISETAMDVNSIMMGMSSSMDDMPELSELDDKIYVNSLLTKIAKGMTVKNNLSDEYIEYIETEIGDELCSAIQYGYGTELSDNLFTSVVTGTTAEELKTQYMSLSSLKSFYQSELTKHAAGYESITYLVEYLGSVVHKMPGTTDFSDESFGKYVRSQYDVIEGTFPKSENEAVLVIGGNNDASDLMLARLGFIDEPDFLSLFDLGETNSEKYATIDFKDVLEKEFVLYYNDSVYEETAPGSPQHPFTYRGERENLSVTEEEGVKIKVSGILRLKEDMNYGCLSSGLNITEGLVDKYLAKNMASKLVKWMTDEANAHPMGGYTFRLSPAAHLDEHYYTHEQVDSYFGMSGIRFTYDQTSVLRTVGGLDTYTSISFYPKDFEAKEKILDKLDYWNETHDTAEKITYTDTIGLMMSMVQQILDAVTYVLVAFTAISLVVSSVMIGIITYVSVVERTKEIGVLRACGARKRDIKNLFNAETFIIGLSSGVFGVAVTYLLSFGINALLGSLTGIATLASLPFTSALIMVAVSIVLTLISGLIPASAAAKKDPVVALRTE